MNRERLPLVVCPQCGAPGKVRHLHDEAHGLPGTHLAGTERFQCGACGAALTRAQAAGWGLSYAVDMTEVVERPVPCGTCKLCCRNDSVVILDHENAAQWLTEPHPYRPGARMLAHKPNRDCVYLDATGCSIHARRPQQCREFDCRIPAATLSWADVQRMQPYMPVRVWRRGRELLNTTTKENAT